MKKPIFIIIAIVAFIAAAVMYLVGKDSSHLSELYDVFWIPLPLGLICLILAFTSKKTA